MEPRESLETWLTVLQTQAVLSDVLEQELQAERGLPLGWFEVLIFLAGEPDGRMRMQDLAGLVLHSKSGVTRLVDRLSDAGLVVRASCLEDRRVTYAQITPAGRKTLAGATPVHLRGVEEHFARHLNAAELRTLRSLLGKVLEANGQTIRQCRPQAAGDKATSRARRG